MPASFSDEAVVRAMKRRLLSLLVFRRKLEVISYGGERLSSSSSGDSPSPATNTGETMRELE